jgi:hypothetical protein
MPLALPRRSFLLGLTASLAAPAVVRAGSLDLVRGLILPRGYGIGDIVTIRMITREAVRLFKDSNFFITHISCQYEPVFARESARLGTTLRLRNGPLDG